MSAGMPADWELLILDLPGRGMRYAEEPIRTPAALVASVVEVSRESRDRRAGLHGKWTVVRGRSE